MYKENLTTSFYALVYFIFNVIYNNILLKYLQLISFSNSLTHWLRLTKIPIILSLFSVLLQLHRLI